MITKKDALKAFEKAQIEFDGDAAVEILKALDVPNAEERVEWLNIITLSLDDIVHLANLEADMVECDMCGEKIWIPRPTNWTYFQGALQPEMAFVEVNGAEKDLCERCWAQNPIFW